VSERDASQRGSLARPDPLPLLTTEGEGNFSRYSEHSEV